MPLVPGGVGVNLCGNTAIYRWLHSSPYSHFNAYCTDDVHSAFYSRYQISDVPNVNPIASTPWCYFVLVHAHIQSTGIVIFLRANQLAREASTHTPDNTQMLPAASFHKSLFLLRLHLWLNLWAALFTRVRVCVAYVACARLNRTLFHFYSYVIVCLFIPYNL